MAFVLLVYSLECPGQVARRLDLPCLAPLIEGIDPEAPKSLEDALLLGPWHEPVLRDGVGVVSFPITVKSAEAQAFFNQGVALLHVFRYPEAERCFRFVQKLEPGNPMAYWGLAMANERRPGRAAVFKAEAKRYTLNRGDLSKSERLWLGLLESPDGLEDAVLAHPDDTELLAFHLRQIVIDHYVYGKPLLSHYAVDLLAEKIAVRAPEHPGKSARLLLWLQKNPQRAASLAEGAVRTSPAVAEVWRYAGQAHFAAGRLEPTLYYLKGAVRLAMADNAEALIEAHVAMGQFAEARDLAKAVIALPRSLDGDDATYRTGRRLLGQVHASLEKWELLLEECQSGVLQGGEADAQFWQGIALVRLGRSDEANGILEAMKDSLKKALASGGSSDMMKSLARTLRNEIAMTHEAETESWLPAVDRARVLFKAGRKEEALALVHTGHFLETATYCDLHFAAGDQKKALFAFDENFQSQALMADATLPIFGRLQGIAKVLNLSPRWQRSRPEWTAPFALPELEAPNIAPPWELPNQEGAITKLDIYKGKPVVLNFFLGVSCPYCRLQLDKFRPLLDAFRAAEVAFIGITTDEPELVKQATSAAPEVFPFPVYCDPKQQVFREYDIFDDFEKFPMHGTVVLDAEGRIIWRNVGHSPFGDPEALLLEIGRLLRTKS